MIRLFYFFLALCIAGTFFVAYPLSSERPKKPTVFSDKNEETLKPTTFTQETTLHRNSESSIDSKDAEDFQVDNESDTVESASLNNQKADEDYVSQLEGKAAKSRLSSFGKKYQKAHSFYMQSIGYNNFLASHFTAPDSRAYTKQLKNLLSALGKSSGVAFEFARCSSNACEIEMRIIDTKKAENVSLQKIISDELGINITFPYRVSAEDYQVYYQDINVSSVFYEFETN